MKLPGGTAPSTMQEVEHLFGRCLLEFQAFELLMKSIVAKHRLSGSTSSLENAKVRRIGETQRKTMGVLVSDMIGSVLVYEGKEGLPDVPDEKSESGFAFCLQLSIPPENDAKIEAEYRALLILRNSLVHHFLDEHDLRSEAGCLVARQALMKALDRVTSAHSDLLNWAAEIELARKAMARFLA